MDKINIQASLRNEQARHSGQQSRPTEYWPDPKHQAVMLRFFNAMHGMYRNRWESAEGLPKKQCQSTGGETFTENFLSWSKRMEPLSTEEIHRGLMYCDELLRKGARGSGTTWPPTLSEFLGYCEPPEKPKVERAHKQFEKLGLPEPKEHKDKRKALGREKCRGLLDFLSE